MTEKQIGILGTSAFHLVVLLILLFFFIYTPVPVSSGGGILIDFGNAEAAGGDFESAEPPSQAEAVQPPVAETEEGEYIMTGNDNNAPAVATTPKNKDGGKKTTPPTVNTKPKDVDKPETTKPPVNTKALYPGKGKSQQDGDKSSGIYKGAGDQGSPDGTPGAGNDGTGSGTGVGAGLGIQVGGGLENRKVLALPKPSYRVQREGKVVVEVTVNRDGTVKSADPGKRGSTTTDAKLLAAAKEAALQSKFAVQQDAKEYQTQTGTITYHFKLE